MAALDDFITKLWAFAASQWDYFNEQGTGFSRLRSVELTVENSDKLKVNFIIFLPLFFASTAWGVNNLCDTPNMQISLNQMSESITPNFLNEEDAFRKLAQNSYDLVKNCKDKMTVSQRACFKNMEELVNSYPDIWSNDHGMGLKISNAEYVKYYQNEDQKALTLPSFFFTDYQLPKDWKNRIQNCSKYYADDQCKQVSAWKYIEYENVCGTIGHTNQKQIIFLLPDGKFDKWASFRRDTPGYNDRKIPTIVISVEKSTNDYSEPKSHFGFFEEGKLSAKGNKCLHCHINGPRMLDPMPGTILGDNPAQKLDELNSIISKYGRTTTPHIPDSSRGPELGSIVGCTECHTSSRAAARSKAPLNFSSIVDEQLFRRFDHPPAHIRKTVPAKFWNTINKIYQLSPEDRSKVKEYFGGNSCDSYPDPVGSYGKTINLLAEKGLISKIEKQEAMKNFTEARNESIAASKYFTENSRLVLKRWLEGGRENCLQKPEIIQQIKDWAFPAKSKGTQ